MLLLRVGEKLEGIYMENGHIRAEMFLLLPEPNVQILPARIIGIRPNITEVIAGGLKWYMLEKGWEMQSKHSSQIVQTIPAIGWIDPWADLLGTSPNTRIHVHTMSSFCFPSPK